MVAQFRAMPAMRTMIAGGFSLPDARAESACETKARRPSSVRRRRRLGNGHAWTH